MKRLSHFYWGAKILTIEKWLSEISRNLWVQPYPHIHLANKKALEGYKKWCLKMMEEARNSEVCA